MDRPAPPVDVYNKPFWEGLRRHVIRMPKCEECGHVQYPMGPVCSACLGRTFRLGGFVWVWGNLGIRDLPSCVSPWLRGGSALQRFDDYLGGGPPDREQCGRDRE